MKTIIDLPEEILHRARVVAAQRKTTFKALVVSGLQTVLSPGAESPGAESPGVNDLAEVLARGHNTEPVGRLRREEIYDCRVLRGH